MLKNIVAGLVAVSVLATPVAAEAKHRDRGGHNRGHHSRISTGEAIAIGMGAFILGAAVSSNRRDDRAIERDVYDREYEYHYRRPVCREVVSSGYDRWGDYYEKRTVRCN
jgi:Ni/Co efflux regulator RcnB